MLQDIEDEDAEILVKKCPVNVFDIEDIGAGTCQLKPMSSTLVSFIFRLMFHGTGLLDFDLLYVMLVFCL